jgi:hypothetical protein
MGIGVVDRLIAEHRAEACAAGRKLSLVYEIACAAPVAEFAAVEIACALTLSRFAAENLVTLAHGLCDRLPAVLSALSNGDIDLPKARVFTDVLADVDVAAAQSIAAVVLPKAPTRTVGQLRDMLRRKALAADPAYTTARRERATAHRSVQLHAADDGTATLTAFGLDAARTAAAMQRIAAIARQRRFAGDPTSAEQLRADVLLELLEGKHDGAARGVVNLTVSLDTLSRFNDDPASLGGYGVIAADIARQWLAAHPGYQWHYAIHHPADGTLLQQGLTRPPTASATSAPAPLAGNNLATGSSRGTASRGAAVSEQDSAHSDRSRGLSLTKASTTTSSGTSPTTASAETSPTTASAGTSATKASAGAAAAGGGTARASSAGAANTGRDTTAAHASMTAACANTAVADKDVPTTKARHARNAGARAEGAAESLVHPPLQDPRDRTASAAMTRWVRLRDKTCRAPGCRMPAWQSDIDHNRRYTDGGLTTHDNLCALCRHHHRAKEEGGWVLVQIRPDHFIWTSPQGRVYEVGPEPP